MTPEPVFPDTEGMTKEEMCRAIDQYSINREKWLDDNGVARVTSRMKPNRSHEIYPCDCINVVWHLQTHSAWHPNGLLEVTYLLMRVGG